jgi:solute carrier family 25 (mitochondrial phosphate transporter), member 23/24/25/41
MFAGAIAGTISRTLTAPLERLKIMYQINHGKPPGFAAVMSSIYKEGGIKAFFRGNGANVMKVAPEMAIKMYTFDRIKAFFAEDDSDVTPWQRFLAGGIAGQVCHASVYPLDVLKIRLAATPQGTYHGIFDAVNKIYAAQGFSAFYRGLTPVLLSTFPHNGINLTCYETIKHEMIKRKDFSEQPGPLELLFCTTIAGTVSQFPTYPVHVIVSRLASQGTPGIPREYTSFFDAFKKITAKEGPRGLYKGILPSLMKSLPSSGISLVVYEYLKRYAGLQKKKHGH